jgi:hypothetical protein
MKYLIILSLLALLSCEAVDNNIEPVPAITASPYRAVVPVIDTPEAVPHTFLDSVQLQMDLTQQQLAHHLHIDTSWERNGRGISAKPLGDSLFVIVMASGNGTCSYAYVCVMNRYTLQVRNKMKVRADCALDTVGSDEMNFTFTDNQEFTITTDTYTQGFEGNSPAVSKREYWTITYDGQFRKNRPDDEERYGS